MAVKWTVSCLIGSMRISLQDQEISLVPHYLQWAMRTADSETWLSPSAFSLVKSRHTFEMLLQRTYPTLSLHIQVCKNMMHRFSREYSSGIAWVALSVCLHMYKLTVLQLPYAVLWFFPLGRWELWGIGKWNDLPKFTQQSGRASCHTPVGLFSLRLCVMIDCLS